MPVSLCLSAPCTWLLCPLSLLLRFTLSLADLWPSGLLALCLARHCPAILTLRSVCLGHPSCAHPSCALASCIGGSSWARRCTFWPACVRSWHFRPRDLTVLAAPLGLLVCVWLLFCLLLGASLHRFPDPPSALPWIPLHAPCPRFAAAAHTPSPSPLPFLVLFVDLSVGALVDPAGASPTRLWLVARAFPAMHVRLSLACARIPIAASVSAYLPELPLALPHPAYLNRLCLLAARTFNFSVLFNS